MSANANDFTDNQGSGGEREEKRLPGPPLSFFFTVFEVLITGVKGQSSSEQHFPFLNMLQKVMFRREDMYVQQVSTWYQRSYNKTSAE